MILCKVVRFIVPWKPLNSGRARVILSKGGDEQKSIRYCHVTVNLRE